MKPAGEISALFTPCRAHGYKPRTRPPDLSWFTNNSIFLAVYGSQSPQGLLWIFRSRSNYLGTHPSNSQPSMSDSFFHYTHMDDRSDGPSFSLSVRHKYQTTIDVDILSRHSASTKFKSGYHVPEQTSCLPFYRTSRGASTVSRELRGGVSPPSDWLADTSIQTQRSATARRFDSSPFTLPSTLRGSPIPSHASDNSLPYLGYNARSGAHHLISEHHPQTVAMSTGYAQYGDGLIDARTCHYDSSLVFAHDKYMVEYSSDIPSPIIAMPIVPTYLGSGSPSYADPILPLDPTLHSPRYPTTTCQNVPPPDSTPSLSPSSNFDSELYSSPGPPLSTGNHGLASLPPEMSDQIPPQPIATSSIGYTFTVPLQNVEFPPFSSAQEGPFYLCRWKSCDVWVTSDKEAVKDHLARTHGVLFRGKMADSACCKWVGCSSSMQKSGLVRHFLTHLGLKWLCSVCKGPYTRPDSVGYHTRKESRCELAHAISSPSPVAYRAKINGDNTVTLIKILQP